MPYVEVDVDLDVFDTDELVEEICTRFKKYGRKKVTDKEKEQLAEAVKELQEALESRPLGEMQIKTLDDKMKFEHLCRVFEKYTFSQIEKLLPE